MPQYAKVESSELFMAWLAADTAPVAMRVLLRAWIAGDHGILTQAVQPSWVRMFHKNPLEEVQRWRVERFDEASVQAVIAPHIKATMMVDCVAEGLFFYTPPQVGVRLGEPAYEKRLRRIRAVMMRENDSGMPDEKGAWRFNPTSMLRGIGAGLVGGKPVTEPSAPSAP